MTPQEPTTPRPPAFLLLPVALAYLALLLGAAALQRWLGELHWTLAVLTYAPQLPFAGGALALFSLALLFRSWRAAAVSTGCLLISVFSLMGLQLPPPPALPPGPASLRLLTLNTDHADARRPELWSWLRRTEPDVVCLQEVLGGADYEPSPGWLQEALPGYRFVRSGQLITFSRLPLVSHYVHPLGEGTGRTVLETVVEVADRRLTVLNTHFIRGGGLPQGFPERWLSYLRQAGTIHARQMSALLAITEGLSPPLVVAGDLNTPPRGPSYRRITGRFTDAFRARGTGLGYTFPTVLPLVRIDYVFTGPGVRVVDYHSPSTSSSDHRPVAVQLSLDPHAR